MFKKIFSFMKLAPSVPRLVGGREELLKSYRYWRIRAFYAVFFGYSFYYICRKNIAVAMPAMIKDLGFSKTDLGIISAVFYIIYAWAKFINGMLCDRSNPRYFMGVGLLIAAVANIFFGFSSTILLFVIFWAINGWVQTMGSPTGPKTMANWYSLSERGSYYGVYNTCHSLGAFSILLAGGFIVESLGWRYGFYLPGLFCILGAIFIMSRLPDRPESVGLAPIEEFHGEAAQGEHDYEEHETIFYIAWHYVLKNKKIWILSFASLFIYIIRYGLVDWAPTYLVEAKGSTIGYAGLKTSALELFGIPGGILAGIASDRIFGARRAPVAVICLFGVAISATVLYFIPPGHGWVDALVLGISGFFIYGPQMLVAGLAAIDFSSRKAAATAVGLTGFMSYVGATAAGYVSGRLTDTFGWSGGFIFWVASAVLGALLMITMWKSKPARKSKSQV